MADEDSPPQTPTATTPAPSTKQENVQTQGVQLLPLLVKGFKIAGLLLFVWMIGYYGFSATWVIFALFFYMVNEEYRKVKDSKIRFAKQAVKNEREAILARTDELPSWVYFPDVERAEWLNKMLRQMWPYIGEYVQTMLRQTVEPQVQNSMPKSLKPFKFERIDLGDIPPRVGGVKVYTEQCKRDEIIMDMEIFYASDSHIKVAIKGLNAGIKDLTIHGTIRIVMKPLVNIVPILGGMSVFFLNPPNIDFDLTDTANFLDLPLLSNTLRTVVEDQIAYYMVLPNKIPIQLVENIDMTRLRYPMPQGVLRIHAVAGRDLKKADFNILGKGKSDPYMKIYVGAQTFKTKVIQDTVQPVWNQYFEAVVDQKHGQFADIEVLDQDPGDDDELGTQSLDIETVAKQGSIDTWLPLENVKTGMIHVRALWLHLSRDPDDLEREKEKMGTYKQSKKSGTEDLLSSSLLLVTLDCAKALPRSKKSMSEPSAYAKLSIGNISKKSMPKPKTTDPKWEENFQFLIHDPYHQDMEVEVLDSAKNDKKLGRCMISLKSLLSAKELTINRPFQLKESGPQTTISMRLCLRVLTSELPADWALDVGSVDTNEKPAAKSSDEEEDAPPDTKTDTKKPEPKPQEPIQVADSTSPDPVEIPSPELPPDQNANQQKSFVIGDPDGYSNASTNMVADTELRHRGVSSSSSECQFGRIEMTMRYSQQRSRLIVVVHRCRDLLPCDEDDLADPYVRLYLLPDKHSKKKTPVVKNNLSPIFDEQFEWSVSLSEAQTRVLEVSIKNKNSLLSRARTNMGIVHVDLSQFNLTEASTNWYEVMDPDTNVSKLSD